MSGEMSPWHYYDMPCDSSLSERACGWVEGYAAALQDIMYDMTGDNGCNKSYDPMTVRASEARISSYAFDLRDGGRSHLMSDYTDLRDLTDVMRAEAVEWIKDTPNARLIAAAPELLHALQQLEYQLGGETDAVKRRFADARTKARAAISKATGEDA